jgi:DNA-binding CsgD family transcriptional regulator
MHESICVLIVTEEPVLAAGFEAVLSRRPGFRVHMQGTGDVAIVHTDTPAGQRAAEECAAAGVPVLRFGTADRDLPRNITAEELIEAVSRAANATGAGPETEPAVRLTRRENELLALVSEGLKNKEISARMGITPGTVKMYLEKLFDKVGARDRYELALYGLQTLRRCDLVQALSSNAGFALLGAVRASRHESHAC